MHLPLKANLANFKTLQSLRLETRRKQLVSLCLKVTESAPLELTNIDNCSFNQHKPKY